MSVSASVLAFLLAAELPAPTVAEPIEPAPEAEIIKTRPDSERRMTVPVRIGKSGPYHFVIDTGSQSSVVSTDLALRLAMRVV